MTTQSEDRILFTPTEALAAIKARINGAWDNPDLERLGPLDTRAETDILAILGRTATMGDKPPLARRFYVTMTWDDWPEGGSYGNVIYAPDRSTAIDLCRQEMAQARAEESAEFDGAETEEEVTAIMDAEVSHYLERYADEWHVVDCGDLDAFIRMHLDGRRY